MQSNSIGMVRIARYLVGALLLLSPALSQAQDTTVYYNLVSFDSLTRADFEGKVSILASNYVSIINASPSRFGYSTPFSGVPDIGDPIRVCVVSAQKILVDSVGSLNTLGKSFTFQRAPVYQDSQLGSSIDVNLAATKTYMFGYPNTTRTMVNVRDSLAVKEGVPKAVYYLVDIPALNLLFIGRTRKVDEKVVLTPLFDYKHYSLAKGSSYFADYVWTKLRSGMGTMPPAHNVTVAR